MRKKHDICRYVTLGEDSQSWNGKLDRTPTIKEILNKTNKLQKFCVGNKEFMICGLSIDRTSRGFITFLSYREIRVIDIKVIKIQVIESWVIDSPLYYITDIERVPMEQLLR